MCEETWCDSCWRLIRSTGMTASGCGGYWLRATHAQEVARLFVQECEFLSSQSSRIVPQQTSNIHRVWNMKSFHLSNSVSEMLPVGSRFHSDCKIHETALGHTSDRGAFNTVGLGWLSFFAGRPCASFGHTPEL